MQPSKLNAGADFHCFKAGIEPKWEDPKCAHGGKWTAQPPRSGGKAALDTYWLHTVLSIFPSCGFACNRMIGRLAVERRLLGDGQHFK